MSAITSLSFWNYTAGDITGIGGFKEEAIGTAFAGSVGTVTIVNKNNHSAA